MRKHCWRVASLLLLLTPTVAYADEFRITSGSFSIARPLIGTEAGTAAFVWMNPPHGAFDSSQRKDLALVAAVWSSDDYSSSLLGGTAPVQPLAPGEVPVGGTFLGSSASFLFLGNFVDAGVPYLESSAAFEFTGGTFTIPSVFPPTDDEGLYLLKQPFSMAGTWLVRENGAVLFDGALSGRGVATLVLGAERATGRSVISALHYQFEDAAPVPEPATLTLCGLGGAAALWARRRTGKQIRRTR